MKKTVLIEKINDDHTGFVQNIGLEELSLFKKLSDNGFELKDKDNISNEELLSLLRYCCVDGFIKGVYNIENKRNLDQGQLINPMKRMLEDELQKQGIPIVPHCDWKPSFDYKKAETIINKRNYLTVLCENIKRLEEDFEQKKRNLNKELENSKIELEKEIENNKSKIKQQNWYIEKTKEAENEYIKANEKLEKEIERYKKGKEYNDNIIKSLPIEIQNMLNEKTVLEENIKELNSQLNVLEGDKKLIEEEIKKEKIKFNNIKKTEFSLLMDEIKKFINSKNWSKKETLEKFERTCKMYILNNRKVPDFEKEHAISDGLSEPEIESILQKYINS